MDAVSLFCRHFSTARFCCGDARAAGAGIGLEVLGLAGLSLLVGLAACEEISWFQRVLGVESSEFFRQHNRQAETNLHNLALGDASLHKTVLLKLIFITGITHNLVLPLLARSRPAIGRFIESIVAVPAAVVGLSRLFGAARFVSCSG